MELQDILTKSEISELQRLNESPMLKEALKKLFLYEAYYCGIIDDTGDARRNFTLTYADRDWSDEEVGKRVRNANAGIHAIERGFDRLRQFKKQKETGNEPNPAR